MSKEARALLKKINDKKNAIKALVNEGKTKEAKEAKAELVDMQDRFNILMDLEKTLRMTRTRTSKTRLTRTKQQRLKVRTKHLQRKTSRVRLSIVLSAECARQN